MEYKYKKGQIFEKNYICILDIVKAKISNSRVANVIRN